MTAGYRQGETGYLRCCARGEPRSVWVVRYEPNNLHAFPSRRQVASYGAYTFCMAKTLRERRDRGTNTSFRN
ncbi:hypothetical protein ACVWY3_002893 [Bradyrhizobium sp. USDA 4486]